MNSRSEQGIRILLGKGKPLSLEALSSMKWVAFSKSPALDWAKGQLAILVFSIALLFLGLVGGTYLVFPEFGQGPGNPDQTIDQVSSEPGSGAGSGVQVGGEARLRNDLFKVPVVKRTVERTEPKTNPAELLRQIELQGVLGGSRPKAIIQYVHNKQSVTVSAGDDLGEFKVMEIQERSVVLKWRDELFELSL